EPPGPSPRTLGARPLRSQLPPNSAPCPPSEGYVALCFQRKLAVLQHTGNEEAPDDEDDESCRCTVFGRPLEIEQVAACSPERILNHEEASNAVVYCCHSRW